MKEYKIYWTNNCDPESFDVNDKATRFIGAANGDNEVHKVIDEFFEKNNIAPEKYWRYLLSADCTTIDYGSWGNFIAIVPAWGLRGI